MPSPLPSFMSMQELTGALWAWGLNGPQAQKRHWTISQWETRWVKVTLTWRFGDSQLGGIDKVSQNMGEAIWLALEEFRKWNRNYGNPI
jgi:hypothetical protein